MSQPTYAPHNPHPLSQLRTELVWEGKYDEYGQQREVNIAGCATPFASAFRLQLQRVESIDEPRRAAAATGQLELFEQQNPNIWQRTSARSDSITYNHIHDTIFFCSKGEKFNWNPQFEDHSDEYLADKYTQVDKDGRKYQLDNMTSPNPRPNMVYEWMEYPCPEKGWRYSKETMQRLHDEGRIWYPSE